MRTRSGRFIRWGELVAQARAHPGSWVVRLGNERVRVVQLVKHRRHRALRLPDGRLEARAINVYRDEYGVRRGDVYIRFIEENHGEEENPPSGTAPPGQAG